MCTYLNKTGATYYFRRPVPDDLAEYFETRTGRPRAEWKFSLRTKDRETAKRRLRRHEIETDLMIDDARRTAAKHTLLDSPQAAAERQLANSAAVKGREAMEMAVGGGQEVSEEALSEREQEDRKAQAELDLESRERRHARSELRTIWRKRYKSSTAQLEPEEAAAIDIMREKDTTIEDLQRALATLKSYNGLYPPIETTAVQESTAPPAISITGLFERYAESGTANHKTVSRWRNRVENLTAYLGHDDASRVTRAELNAWVASLVTKGLSKKTIVAGYIPAIRVTLAVAFEDGVIPSNPAKELRVRGPRAVTVRDRSLSDDDDLPPEKWTILGVREPAIYGLKGADEWHGRDTRQNRLSGCCERPKFGYRKERTLARSAGRWESRSRAIIAGARNMAG